MGKTIMRNLKKWRYKQEILQSSNTTIRKLPTDFNRLKMKIKPKIYNLKEKAKNERNKIRKCAIEEVIEIYKDIIGE